MSNLKHKLPIWIMGALVFVGTIDEWFFWDPEHGKALVTKVISGGTGNLAVGIAGIALLGVPILIGWSILMFGRDQLQHRLHWFWTPFGLLIVTWAWLTFYNTSIMEFGVSLNTFITASPELYRATAFGFLIAFYRLDSAAPLWYFYWIWAWAGIVMYGAEIPKLFGGAGVPWSEYFKGGEFWHNWGYSLLDAYIVPLAFVAMYYIIKWRKAVLKKEGERHLMISAVLEGIGLWWVLLWRRFGRRGIFRK